MKINEALAKRILEVIDVGLDHDIGDEPVPGKICAEAAVCYALGQPHGDDPVCVAPSLRALVIITNDAAWSTKTARAAGLRRLALAQLGSRYELDEREFMASVDRLAIQKYLPIALRAAAEVADEYGDLERAALDCEADPTWAVAAVAVEVVDEQWVSHERDGGYSNIWMSAKNAASFCTSKCRTHAAFTAVYAADCVRLAFAGSGRDIIAVDAAVDAVLGNFAEDVVQILIDIKSPGCRWLPLTEIQ
jgi:hypothetical protein